METRPAPLEGMTREGLDEFRVSAPRESAWLTIRFAPN